MSHPLVLIQARTASTRLPGKINLRIGPARMLDHVIDRVRQTGLAWRLCHSQDFPTVAEEDVLGRFHQALFEIDPLGDLYDPIVRVTADCPMWEGQMAAWALHAYRANFGIDLVYTSPAWDGLDVEVMSRAALARAHLAARDPYEREHVTAGLRRGHAHMLPLDGPALRFSVDDAESLAFVRAVFAACEHCLAGVNHHTNAAGSIGGGDRHVVWDLHHLERGDLVECTAADLLRARMQKEPYVSV